MTDTPYLTRRATVEDLPQLIALWQLERLPAGALEKRFTEFQVVSDEAGVVLAAIGLQIAGAQGWLHSEAIGRAEISDALRDLLWKRLQVIIQNHALERLWTQMNSTAWRERGFDPADEEQLKLRPPAFTESEGEWRVITLRAAQATAVLEREFAEVKNLQQQERMQLQNRVRWMKRVALGVTVIVFLLLIAWAAVMLKLGPRLFQGR
jgi:N-acetylglutamate synthase-like GNAT family acetyltransferase